MPELVALQARLPQFDTPFDVQGKALQLRQLMNANQASDMELAQRRQAMADEQAARSVFAENPEDAAARLAGLAKVSPGAYSAEAKRQSDLAKTAAETRAKQITAAKEKFQLMGQSAGYVRDNPTLDNALRLIGNWQNEGLLTAEQASQYADTVRKDPAKIQGLATEAYQSAIDAEKQLPKIENINLGGQEVTQSVSPVTGQVRTLNTRQRTQSPDSVASVASQAADRAQRERIANADRAARSERDRSQIIQTDEGPLVVNTGTGAAQPVTLGGQAVQARAIKAPATVQKALFENDAALRKIEDAFAAIDAYPGALGAVNYLGDTIRQRSDPKGVEARALVADIGSLKLHDRSGAAVTAAETPRLKPFIPAATDTPDTAKKKLELFRREYQTMQDDILASYPKAGGGRAAKPRTVQAPPTNARGWALHTDAQGNRAYVSPDGTQFEEVQ